jgi:hypothetical protein
MIDHGGTPEPPAAPASANPPRAHRGYSTADSSMVANPSQARAIRAFGAGLYQVASRPRAIGQIARLR